MSGVPSVEPYHKPQILGSGESVSRYKHCSLLGWTVSEEEKCFVALKPDADIIKYVLEQP